MSTAASQERTCPDRMTLRRFLAEELAGAAAVAVQEHIDGCPVCQQELGRLIGGAPGALDALFSERETDCTTTVGAAAPPAAAPLEVIGPYRLVRQIGQGGMGTVFLAEQLYPVRRSVALKLIRPGLDSRQVIARFEAERQALALMDHPNIAKVLDAGTVPAGRNQESGIRDQESEQATAGKALTPDPCLPTPVGRPYFVMELVRGEPLTAYCDRQRLTLPRRLELFMRICQAVQHAHQKGIIHRDLKPSNILTALYDDRPTPKIIDFGIAKATGPKLTDQTLVTEPGWVVGTLEYMSPEQAELGQPDIDTRGDIYSLGVVLYELLTGTTPVRRQGEQAADFVELLRKVREEEPATPSKCLGASAELPEIAANRNVEPKKLLGLVRGDLDWIVMKCLEKDRARRYETASALMRDVERYLNEEPVEASPPSAGYRLRKFARKHRKLIAAGAAFVLVLLAGTVVSTWQAVRATLAEESASWQRDKAKEQAAIADRERAKAKEEAAIAEAVNDFLNYDLLFQASPEMTADRDLTLRTVLDRASRNIEGRFPSQPVVEAKIRTVLAVTYQSLGEYAAAERHGLRARTLYRDALGPEHSLTLGALNNLAIIYAVVGRLEEARNLLEEVVRLRRRILGPGNTLTLGAVINLAEVLMRQDRLVEARQLIEEVLDLQLRAFGPEPEIVKAMGILAAILRRQGQLDKARMLLDQALELNGRLRPPEYAARISIMRTLGQVRQTLGRHRGACNLYEEALRLAYRVLGPKHSDTLIIANDLAWLLATTPHLLLRDPPRALVLAKQFVEDMPKDGNNWNTLGAAYCAAGDWQNAITALEKSEQLTPGRLVAHNGFFLAMAHWQLSRPAAGDPETTAKRPPLTALEQARHRDAARQAYHNAVQWLEKNSQADLDLPRFRAEAAKLLGLADAQLPFQNHSK
jgi:non-specific serine/threonine protein kinase/serine/threonine-protein kinase